MRSASRRTRWPRLDGPDGSRNRRRIARPSIRDRIARLDWVAIERALDERGYATIPSLVARDECARLAALYPRRAALPDARRHGAPSLRRGRVQVLLRPAPAARGGAARRALHPPRRGREPLGGGARDRDVPADARGVPGALCGGGAAASDAASPPLHERRLQLPAPGSVRAARLSAPAHVPAERGGRGLHRRRVPARRAAPTPAVTRRGDRAPAGRRDRL